MRSSGRSRAPGPPPPSQHHRLDVVRIFRHRPPRELRSFGGQIFGRQVGAEALETIMFAELGFDQLDEALARAESLVVGQEDDACAGFMAR